MTVQINYKNSFLKKSLFNPIFFVNEKFNLEGLKKNITINEYSYISELLKTRNIIKKDILFFRLIQKK